VHHLIDVRSEDQLKYDDQGVATLFTSADASVAFGRIMPGQMGMQGLAVLEAEDNAYVMSGMLSYPASAKNEEFAARGAWVVARPGEIHGYLNKGAKPATLFIFRPRAPGKAAPGAKRIFTPADSAVVGRVAMNRSLAYETPASRGEALTLHPGETTSLAPVLCSVLLVTEGRMMALFNREKISLDHGEGLVFVREAVEVVGVGGRSHAVVFSTTK